MPPKCLGERVATAAQPRRPTKILTKPIYHLLHRLTRMYARTYINTLSLEKKNTKQYYVVQDWFRSTIDRLIYHVCVRPRQPNEMGKRTHYIHTCNNRQTWVGAYIPKLHTYNVLPLVQREAHTMPGGATKNITHRRMYVWVCLPKTKLPTATALSLTVREGRSVLNKSRRVKSPSHLPSPPVNNYNETNNISLDDKIVLLVYTYVRSLHVRSFRSFVRSKCGREEKSIFLPLSLSDTVGRKDVW